MKNHLTIFCVAILGLSTLMHSPSAAQDCASAAQTLSADNNNAEILTVVALADGTCEVTLSIPGKAGVPPRVVTKRVNG